MELIKFFLTAQFSILPADKYFYVWKKNDYGKHHSEFFQGPHGIPAACDYVEANKSTGNLYFGVTPCHQIFDPFKRPKIDESAGLVGMWLDVDIKHPCHKKDNLPPDVNAAWQLATSIEIQPSLVVASGHGYHFYWLLRDFLPNTPETAHLIKSILNGWKQKFQGNQWGYAVDSVFDESRVLRIPDTLNRKAGQQPAPVQLVSGYSGIEFNQEGLTRIQRYSLEECFRAVGVNPPVISGIPAGIPSVTPTMPSIQSVVSTIPPIPSVTPATPDISGISLIPDKPPAENSVTPSLTHFSIDFEPVESDTPMPSSTEYPQVLPSLTNMQAGANSYVETPMMPSAQQVVPSPTPLMLPEATGTIIPCFRRVEMSVSRRSALSINSRV